MIYTPKGAGTYDLNTIILDLNGTLAVNGQLVTGAEERLLKLKEMGFKILLFSGDQRGNALELSERTGIELKRATSTEEKEALTNECQLENTVSIGNARIDIGTFRPARLSIATLQGEGIHTEILQHVDILMLSINDALDLLINKDTFEATMRK
jgi:soluble P-type ATPase